MKLTLGWLKDHLDTDAPVDDIADKLGMLGLPVEDIHNPAAELGDFVVGYVKDAKQHPDADRLRVCIVDTGKEELQVVCGAPNARTGMKGVFAPLGATIPATGMVLKKTKIRGQESSGMLCSEREMGLSDDHEGIIELPNDAPTGAPYAEIAGLNEPVLEVELTPNRGDCASARGLARDLAAAGLGTLKPLNIPEIKGGFESPVQWRLDLAKKTADACPMVVGRYFRNVKNGPSPKWLQDRLTAIGLRPISALVDITNWCTFDLGRPLHVFDADTISGDLTMRLAKTGETLGALDGKSYALDDTMVVIANDDVVQGIGGVMGGEDSGCGPDTTNVFLEVALFDPIRIAATGRKLGIISDARYRFERGVDPTSALWGADVASQLILDLCGGKASELSIAGDMPKWQRQQTLRLSRILSLGGTTLADGEPARILTALGFKVREKDDVIHADVPPWRPDIGGEADLIEEVLRISGYDDIPPVPLPRDTVIPKPVRTPYQNRAEAARRALAARGLVECVTFSFLPGAQAEMFGGGADSLRLVNPISADLDIMRPSVLPNLLDAVARNQARALDDAALFEIGPQYADDTPEGQSLVAAGIRAGGAQPRHWAGAARPADAFDAKADALAALGATGAPTGNLQVGTEVPGWYHPGRSGTLSLGPNMLARFGELHPAVVAAMDVRSPVAAFEVFFDNLPEPKAGKGAAKKLLALATLQPVQRDFAFTVDKDLAAAKVIRAAAGAEKKLITGVALFDVFDGKGVEDGKKSLAITVTLQPVEATLTDEQIDQVAKKIVTAVEKSTGGILRS